MSRRFAPTPLKVDTSRLSAGDRQALGKLIEAGHVIATAFFLREQIWSGNESLLHQLESDHTPLRQPIPFSFGSAKDLGPPSTAMQHSFPAYPSEGPLELTSTRKI